MMAALYLVSAALMLGAVSPTVRCRTILIDARERDGAGQLGRRPRLADDFGRRTPPIWRDRPEACQASRVNPRQTRGGAGHHRVSFAPLVAAVA